MLTHKFLSLISIVALMVTVATRQAAAAEAQTGLVCPPEKQKNQPTKNLEVTSFEVSDDKVVYLFPQGDLYPFNIADPHRVGLSFQTMEYTESRIPGVGNTRFYLKAGANLGIFRVTNKCEPDHGWQLNIIGGFDAMFDIDDSLDNIGWDGNYGITLTIDEHTDWLYKLGILHTSSHLGDEYIEETGMTRTNYTRHELFIGLSRLLTNHWRVYGEGGWGFHVGNTDLMKPWRLKGGVEYVGDKTAWKNRGSWYAAIDIQSWQESDWDFDVSTQVGMEINSAGRRARLGLEYYEGRVPIGEFFQYYENYISFGVWVDI